MCNIRSPSRGVDGASEVHGLRLRSLLMEGEATRGVAGSIDDDGVLGRLALAESGLFSGLGLEGARRPSALSREGDVPFSLA